MINIHGKMYVTVIERVQQVHSDVANEKLSIVTECVQHDPVLFKATVTTQKGVFTGWSAANPKKTIEAQSPYEVAETSAVGRALGFAGYGLVEDIATADEMKKSEVQIDVPFDSNEAGMGALKLALEWVEKYQQVNIDKSKVEAIAESVKGLKDAITGKKHPSLTKQYVQAIKDKAKEKYEEEMQRKEQL